MTVRGKNKIRLDDVLVVEVWLASGQSNMEWSFQHIVPEEKAYAALPYFFSDLFDLSFEVWGDDLTSWDRTVLRGSLEEESFAFFYFDRGQMVGVLAVDRPDEERKPMQHLVRVRVRYEDVAARLREAAVGLDRLIE